MFSHLDVTLHDLLLLFASNVEIFRFESTVFAKGVLEVLLPLLPEATRWIPVSGSCCIYMAITTATRIKDNNCNNE